MIIDLVDKFADRVIQLLTYKQQKHLELLEKHVTPVFEEFERVHSAYLESFSDYRHQILNAPNANWIPALQATLRKDNLFSKNTRIKIKRIAEAGFSKTDDPFTKGICDYVKIVRDNDPKGDMEDIQRWRMCFLEALAGIAEGDWAIAAGTFYLKKNESAAKTREVCAMYPFPRKVKKEDAIKRAFALYSLDSIVSDMQKQYDIVCTAYMKLTKELSK